MATNSAIVTALATSIQRKSAYRGNVQTIPVEVTVPASASAEALTLSEVLPPNTELIGISLECSALSTNGKFSIGYTGDADAILNDVTATSAANGIYPGAGTAGLGAPVAVGGKAIIGTVTGTDAGTLNGYILVVTDE